MTEDAFMGRRDKERLMKILGSRMVSRRQQSWFCKPLSELNAIAGQNKRMFSYLQLPEDFPPIISTGREDQLRKHINDIWVSVASGSEDFSFKVTRKNPYEEQLCKCEDERFEHDMAINCYDHAISILEKLLSEIAATKDKGEQYVMDPQKLEGSLRRQMKKIYLDMTDYMINGIKMSPAETIELCLKQIKQKRDHNVQARNEQNKTWRDLCDKNYTKSLDHRAFYFKQNDKKNTNTKCIAQFLIADV